MIHELVPPFVFSVVALFIVGLILRLLSIHIKQMGRNGNSGP